MQIKTSQEGILIYAAMAIVFAGLMICLYRKVRWQAAAAIAACGILLTAWGIRWHEVGHIPMQNMFEVFLTLGAFLFPIGFVARRFTGICNQVDIIGDFALAFILLFPAGFIFPDTPQKLPPALQSPLFGPHVAVYMLSYILMAKAAMQAAAGLFQKQTNDLIESEQNGYLFVCIGFPLLSAGLFLGSVWGKFAWGDWWGWDPKELWSLACWLMYCFYFHWRFLFKQKLPRANCAWMIAAFVLIIVTLVWVNLSRLFPGMHNYAS